MNINKDNNIFQDFGKLIEDSIRDYKEEQRELALKQIRTQLKREYHERYMNLALGVSEIIEENKDDLLIEVPTAPIKLIPPSYKQHDINGFYLHNEYIFIIDRNKKNYPSSDSYIHPLELIEGLGKSLKIRGFVKYRLSCSQEKTIYTFTIRTLEGFKMGKILDSRIGKLHFNESIFSHETQTYGAYDISYPGRQPHGGLKANTKVNVYHNGYWLSVIIMIRFDEYANPYYYLSGFPVEAVNNKYIFAYL